MCNCNQKRANYSTKNLQGRQTQDAHHGMNQVKLLQQSPMEINGEITGRKYVFKKLNDINWVDKRDLVSMQQIKELQILF